MEVSAVTGFTACLTTTTTLMTRALTRGTESSRKSYDRGVILQKAGSTVLRACSATVSCVLSAGRTHTSRHTATGATSPTTKTGTQSICANKSTSKTNSSTICSTQSNADSSNGRTLNPTHRYSVLPQRTKESTSMTTDSNRARDVRSSSKSIARPKGCATASERTTTTSASRNTH